MQSIIRDLGRYVCNQRGVETAEWIVIVALITVVVFLVYASPNSPLVNGLTQILNDVVTFLASVS